MKTYKEGVKLISAQNKRIDAETKHRDALLEQLKAFCPVKIGDTVDVLGFYAFRGKKILVDRIIVYTPFGRVDGFVVTGRVLKADGTPGAHRARSEVRMTATKERKNG